MPTVYLLAVPDPVHNIGKFEWNTNYVLKENEQFEVVFWKPGEDPFAIDKPTLKHLIEPDLCVLDNTLKELFDPGEYQWGVRLAWTNSLTLTSNILSDQGSASKFTYQGCLD
jgi:hypothetical protein